MAPSREHVVLSWGLGVDSTSILVRWLTEPASRDFALEDLIVVTAMTGDEFDDTGRLVRAHALPLLAAHTVRYVQLARNGPRRADGIRVLDDSRHPTALHLNGAWRLSDELLAAATVPQVSSGRRICSCKFKGEPIDAFLASELAGRPYQHVLGFNADEDYRVARDRSYAVRGRDPVYPLVEWGWGRRACEAFLEAWAGEAWQRSCCKWCPFGGSAGSLPGLLRRYREMPAAAAEGLFLETMALAFNPNVALFGRRRLRDALVEDENTAAIGQFVERLVTSTWALYDVRRVILGRGGDPTRKGPAWRSVRRLETGTRSAMVAALQAAGATASDELTPRAVLEARGTTYPTRERQLVAAPAVATDKERPGFERQWSLAVPAPCSAA